MIIRAEQFSAFQSRAEECFVTRLIAHVRKKHASIVVRMPGATSKLGDLSDEVLRALVSGGIRRGRGFGLTWESALAVYVTLRFVAAPNFDQHPDVTRELHSEDVVPDQRMARVYQFTSDTAWKEIKVGYDPEAWWVPR